MALMDMVLNLIKGAMGGQGQQGGGDMLSNIVTQMLQNGVSGGAGGLLQQLEQAGLGQHVQSWLGSGQNMPVEASQITSALGSSQLGELAAKFGISPDMVSQAMSQYLPAIIDKMSPHGTLQSH